MPLFRICSIEQIINSMEDTEHTEYIVQVIIMEIMLILHKNNIPRVHMGGLLRLLGVDEEIAQQSDGDYIELDADFSKYLTQITRLSEFDQQNQSIH